jgi:endoglucanase
MSQLFCPRWALLLTFTALTLSACSFSPTPIQPTEPTTPQPREDLLFGAYIQDETLRGMEAVEALETDLGKRLDIVQWFRSFDDAWLGYLLVNKDGRIPLITWQPHDQTLQSVIDGDHDNYLRSWALGAKEFGKPIYIRLMPEMNGYWIPWYDTPERFVATWKHIVDIFKEEGASNVKWVWSVNCVDEPPTPENRFENYYPGSDYVDVLAIDGFNWGTSRSYHIWRSFEDTFRKPYDRIIQLGKQDVWITETASTEQGGDKAQWVKDMFAAQNFERIKAIVWFNERKETDWRVQSSEASLEAFQEALDADSESAIIASR